MAMDWLSGFTGAYAPQPQEDVEDDEDFYGFGDADGEADTTAGAQTEESVGSMACYCFVPLTTTEHPGHISRA